MLNITKKQLLIPLFFFASQVEAQMCQVRGELRKWHKVILDCEGPETSENATPNPFTEYRMDVYFERDGKEIKVPGFYAADGNAHESSSVEGNIWRAILSPDQEGVWKYRVSFRTGPNIAVSLDPNEGSPTGFNGESGSFSVEASDKKGRDFRATGRVSYTGEHYLRHAETNKFFIKNGVDEPENLLAFVGFDATKASHFFPTHVNDWKEGDPTWKNGKGKAIIGAINYLASQSVNSMYFLTYNVSGDGKDVWMWTSETERTRFDVSKLAQWDVVFDHMDKVGMSMHVVTQETENDQLLSNGTLGLHRKLYFRELVARFAHHLSVTWNLGEEFSLEAMRGHEFGSYIKALDPYPNPVVIHTFPGAKSKENIYGALLGLNSIDGASLQVDIDTEDNNSVVSHWKNRSSSAGRKWLVQHDETGPVGKYIYPDSEDPHHYQERYRVLWSTLLAGGAGFEWIFFAKKSPDRNLKTENFRLREHIYKISKHAVDFVHQYLPFWEMQAANGLSSARNDFVFAKEGEIYAIYLPQRARTSLTLNQAGLYDVYWFDPRNGGALQRGSITQVSGTGEKNLGNPPSAPNDDWVVLVKKSGASPQPEPEPQPDPDPQPQPPATTVFQFQFYDEVTKQPVPGVAAIEQGSAVDFKALENLKLNILVSDKERRAKSFTFSHNSSATRTESSAPFTVFKEDGVGHPQIRPGTHTIVARAFTSTGAKGRLIGEDRLTFTIVEGPDVSAPKINSVHVSGKFRVVANFNEACRATLSYKSQVLETWKTISSAEFRTTHTFEITNAEEIGWVYKMTCEDSAQNVVESPTYDLVYKRSVFPGSEWELSTPEDQGMAPGSVSRALEYLRREIKGDINNVAIVRNGYLVHRGSNSTANVWAASANKSFTSTVLGILIDEGTVKLIDKAARYEPSLQSRYADVELRHFATMTSGYDGVGGRYGPNGQDGSREPLNVAAPSFAPGTHYAYWDDAMNMFGNVLTQAAKENLSSVFKRRIADKIGMKNYTWSVGWNHRGLEVSSGSGSNSERGGSISIGAEDMARYCYLMLNQGNWDGAQLLSQSWVSEATKVQVPANTRVHQKTQGWIAVGTYGYNWWVNGVGADGKKLWPDLPNSTYAARGTNGNMCVVVPDWNLVFVRMGSKGNNSQSVINGTLKILGEGL